MKLKKNDKAPNFKLKDTNGNPILNETSLVTTTYGKATIIQKNRVSIIYLNFWSYTHSN